METNAKTASLNGLSVKLNELLVRQAAEQTRIEKIAPQKAGYIMADGFTPAQKAEVFSVNAMPQTTPEQTSAKQKKVNGLKALGWIVKQKAGKIDDHELVTLKSINDDIKIVLNQIRDLTKSSVKTSGGNGIRAAPSANGKNAKPEGYYKVTDQIRKAMNVRNETKVGNDMIATYTVNGVDRRSKIVNAAIAYHKMQAK